MSLSSNKIKETCLVTGAAGFIGSHLSEALVGKGFKVIGIDCFTDYYSKKIKESNLSALINNRDFCFVDMDIRCPDIQGIVMDVEYIFHHAAQAGVRASWGKDFEIYTEYNIRGTQVLLEYAKESNKLKKFIYASSSSVYGDIKDIPMKETSYLQPVSPYGVTKLAAEHLCYLYWRNFGVKTVSLRYFTVFGPRQRPDMAFHKFLRSCIEGTPIYVYGDGNQTRDFTYVMDIVSANLSAMKNGLEGGIYNIGGGNRVTLNRVLSLIQKLVGVKLNVHNNTPQKGDMRHTWADIGKAKRDLNYQPLVGLEEGLVAELKWLENLKVQKLI